MKSLISLLLSSFFLCAIQAQKPVDLMLKSSTSVDESSCFDIMIRSAAGHKIDLAGQNYRIFYNADRMSFLEDRISHDLDPETYSKIDLLNTVDHNVGFVSISIDGRTLSDKGLQLDRAGSWEKSINICFDRSTTQPFDLTWANSRKTALFATAEVALSEWVDKENQQILTPNEVYDYSSLDQDQNSLAAGLDLSIYPNPVADHINIDFSRDVDLSDLIIKDVIGRELVNEAIDGGNSMNLTLGDWPEGTYTVVVLDKNGKRVTSQNIVKINP